MLLCFILLVYKFFMLKIEKSQHSRSMTTFNNIVEKHQQCWRVTDEWAL